LRSPEMRGQNHASATAHRELQRWQRLADARIVAHFAAVKRHVEIHTDENALALQVEVANREFVHGDDLAERHVSARRRTRLQLRGEEFNQVAAAAGVAPLVVVPSEYFRA